MPKRAATVGNLWRELAQFVSRKHPVVHHRVKMTALPVKSKEAPTSSFESRHHSGRRTSSRADPTDNLS
jgi:hypothetical protein